MSVGSQRKSLCTSLRCNAKLDVAAHRVSAAFEISWRGRVRGKGEGPRENWEKVQVLWICRGVGVVPSRVLWDEYRNKGVKNDHQMMPDISA